MVGGMNGFPWYFLSKDVSYTPTDDFQFGADNLMDIPEQEKTIGFVHVLLDQDGVESPWLVHFAPLLDNVQDAIGSPIEYFRVRLAMTLNHGKDPLQHNAPHTDHETDHYAALYYLHDSNADTVFFNEYDDPNSGDLDYRWWKARQQDYTIQKRVKPKANNLFVFDGHQFHSSSNPHGDENYRVTLNLNFRCDNDLFASH
tara:strand:- start:474 stop:1073 length:600 start_codon:yes stop_codon:yes gene_type:complete